MNEIYNTSSCEEVSFKKAKKQKHFGMKFSDKEAFSCELDLMQDLMLDREP